MAETAPWDDAAPSSGEVPPWGAQPAEVPRGLLGTLESIPGDVAALATPQGRAAWAQVPVALAKSVYGSFKDFFTLPHDAAFGEVSPEQEIERSFNAAQWMGGGEALGAPKMPAGADAIAPIAKAFDDGVAAPAAVRLDAFARTGDPNGVRLEPPHPEVVPAPIRPIEGSPFAGVPRSVAARTGVPEVDAVLGSPVTQAVIDHAVIDRSHDIPYMAGASKELNDPTVFVDRHVPKEQTVGGVTFDPADPWVVHENVEQHTMQLLTDAGMDDQAAYKVAHFDFAEPAEQAWYRAHGIDQEAAEAQQAKWLPRIQHEPTAGDVPESLYKKPYPHDRVPGIDREPVTETPPTPEDSARGKQTVRDWAAKQTTSAQPMLAEARELGVIGWNAPENVNLAVLAQRANETPGEAAFRAVPPQPLGAAVTPEEMRGPFGHAPGSYDSKGKEWVSKIDSPESAREAIEQIASSHDWFPESRAGKPSLASRAAMAEAAGIDASELNSEYFAEHFDNDGKVRAVIQVMRQATQDFTAAAEKTRLEPNDENAAAQLKAEKRQEHILEFTLGKRAESARSLNAWKELLRDQEASKAKVKLKAGEQSGDVPEGTAELIGAARDVESNLGQPGKAPGLDKLIKAAGDLVEAHDKRTAEEATAKLPADLAGLVDQARKTLRSFKGSKTELDRLVANAERQAVNMVKQKAVRRPIEALPPELQALVDKAARVTKRFGGISKGEEAAFLLAQSGRTAAEQAELARSVEGLSPNQVARVLEKVRKVKDPHWTFAVVQQGLISGLVTHTFYPIINAMQSVLDRVLAPEVAALTGKALGNEKSALAPVHAAVSLVRSVPDAVAGAVQAFKTGMRVPLESEMRLSARGEQSPEAAGAKVPYGQPGLRINWGTFKPDNFWGRVLGTTPEGLEKAARIIGIPGRSANFQHTFFKIINERASLSARAYEAAAFEAKPGSEQFWNRYQFWLDNPTDEMLSGATTDGYSGTFMDKLGPRMQRAASLVRDTPVKWVMFFTHIPFKIVQRGIENSPVALLHLLSQTRTGMALKGELGSDAAHLSWAHVALGTAFSAYVMNKALGGLVTGDYPTDPKEQARWRVLGIQANSINVAGSWISLTRFGSIGLSARLAANWVQAAQHYENDPNDTLLHAGLMTALGTGQAMLEDVGFETLKGLIDVMEGRQKAEQFAAYHVASILQPVSMLSQAASFTDPHMRQANSLLAGLMERLPVLRQMLPEKRDPLFGEPVPNPGYHTILRESPVNRDPIKAELDRIQYYPTAPQRTIGGVKLTDEQYDRYEATAGPLVKQMLAAKIRSPYYQRLPLGRQRAIVKDLIDRARASARHAMQMADPELLQAGIAAKRAAILGHP